jgi:hypothetical protein
MHLTRWFASLAIGAMLLGGCGGAGAPTQAPPGATSSTGGTASQVPATTEGPAATQSGGGGGGAGLDVEAVANKLIPPHSTEVTKTTAEDTWFAVYESTDSIDSLKSFYQDAIAKAGLRIFSTTTVSGGVSYVIATDESGSFGGAVNIYPSGDSKTAVQVTIGKT